MPDLNPAQPDPSLDARTLRLLADDELGQADRARVHEILSRADASSESARSIVQGEQALRSAVGRCMGAAVAPASLRTTIQQTLADAPVHATSLESSGHAVVARIDGEGVTHTRDRRSWLPRLFSSPQRASFAAVAAVLALIAGAVLFGIFGRSIDDVPVQRGVDVVANVAGFVDKEHTECTTSLEHIQKQSTFHTLGEAEVGLTELLGVPVASIDLSQLGYDFVGAGPCDVPLDKQPSGHLMYRKSIKGRPGPMVSVFVAANSGCCKGICAGMHPGDWAAAESSGKRRVLYSTDGKLVYFLVCCDERDLPAVGQAITLAQPARVR